ncbi:MAG: DUF1178 family protein [Pseudomonadota bacterium]
MIKYALKCSFGHEFEGWFRSSDDFDQQQANGELCCPTCSTTDVQKAIMAPAIAKGSSADKKQARVAEVQAAMAEAASKARDYVEKNFDYVGNKFPEEARKIHYGETEKRAVYGEASPKEAKALVDEGVAIAPVPGAPTPPDKKN